jgi:hypothetical protein
VCASNSISWPWLGYLLALDGPERFTVYTSVTKARDEVKRIVRKEGCLQKGTALYPLYDAACDPGDEPSSILGERLTEILVVKFPRDRDRQA